MRKKNQGFEQDYINYYIEKVEYIKNKYPNITGENRRTGRALKNICFFIWYYAKEEDNAMIDLLLKASVLLVAQDDFYDSLNISNGKKKEFYSVCVNVIKGGKYNLDNETQQFMELVNLWKEINQEVKNASSYLYAYWKNKSLELNDAMLRENDIIRQKNVTFNEYIKVSTNSVGIIFIWATYFTKKNISNVELKKIDPTLFIGAEISRLSNDIASYRRKKNRINAISVVKNNKSPKKYILNLIKKEHIKFNNSLSKVKIENEVKQVIKKSVDFLEMFYKTSDFDQ